MIRILVADDEHLVRDAITGLLDLKVVFEVIGQADSGDEALAAAPRLRPDVAPLRRGAAQPADAGSRRHRGRATIRG
ncbi:response regulator transcription factor [Amycolatopsis taiwanensis]|uniref:Response regulatory domain-containing protein n=1 Tax=Amycolatopsis taiwanensis TaxID=342230 RepID=A0A9W6R7W4_9PSEU|nr:response regulator transcription factor [Amycolatopsis taiwanensis]GLY69070.1 hypothetical protein Atai01_56890 [Amycolatopsis taiwanensis]